MSAFANNPASEAGGPADFERFNSQASAGIGLFSTLFFVAGPLIAATRFLKSGISSLVVLEFMGWDFAGFISLTLPLAMLVAALLGFERLSRDSEAVALFAGGIRFQRIIAPVAALSLLVSVVGAMSLTTGWHLTRTKRLPISKNIMKSILASPISRTILPALLTVI